MTVRMNDNWSESPLVAWTCRAHKFSTGNLQGFRTGLAAPAVLAGLLPRIYNLSTFPRPLARGLKLDKEKKVAKFTQSIYQTIRQTLRSCKGE